MRLHRPRHWILYLAVALVLLPLALYGLKMALDWNRLSLSLGFSLPVALALITAAVFLCSVFPSAAWMLSAAGGA
jgi:hypothetical protein